MLRGSDADNLAVLVDNTGKSSLSYTDSTVTAETTYAYAIRARNADGLSPQTERGFHYDPSGSGTAGQAHGPAPRTQPRQGSACPGTNPGDDSITGYQILRGPDAADSLTVLTNDTGSASASYTGDTVEEETEYFYAIRARNAEGLGPQSDPISVRTLAAPVEPESDLAVAGVEFTLDGQDLDTGGHVQRDRRHRYLGRLYDQHRDQVAGLCRGRHGGLGRPHRYQDRSKQGGS